MLPFGRKKNDASVSATQVDASESMLIEKLSTAQGTKKDTDDDDDNCFCSSAASSDIDGTSTAKGDEEDDSSDDDIAPKETSDVKRGKVLVYAVLLFPILGVIGVFFYNKHFEKQQFVNQYYYDSHKIIDALGSSFDRALGSLDSLAMTIVSIAYRSNQTFPFVTIPEYGMHIAKTMPFTGAVETSILPVVTFDQRAQWEQYAARNNTNLLTWVNESQRLQDHWDDYFGPKPQNYPWEASDVIYGDFGTVPYNKSRPNRPDILLPEWHKFPIIPRLYPPANFDWLSIQYPESLVRTYEEKKISISQPMMIPRPDNPNATIEAENWCEYYKDELPPDENCMEPTSLWFYPIVDKYEEISIMEDPKYPDDYTVKAILLVTFYWRRLLQDILPSGSKGMVIVIDSTCFADDFTYQIDGPKAKYLGVGDWHDTKYDNLMVNSSMIELINSKKVGRSTYSGLPMATDSCVFDFRVYPSGEMENDFHTNNGIIFVVASIIFIVIPFVVFISYDRKIARRQNKILTTAKRSNAIISSLYPSNVRNQLYPTVTDAKLARDGTKGGKINGNIKSSSGMTLVGGPIADLYPETTVLFADIVSFTAWSSTRDPLQVFTLLESIYGAFDEITARRNIFKVETVGDCYVCVSGLPDPRRGHALAMARFACEIIHEMRTVTTKLEVALGPGTANLTIRVGMNSGPTTAGVLRGAKGRFQLFGDTVNTASRMESNSKPNRILCTQKTADLLIAAGKEKWLTLRSETVYAKGKGAMQCYWVHPLNRGSDSGSGRSLSIQSTTTSSDQILNSSCAFMDDSCFDRYIAQIAGIFETTIKEVIDSRRQNSLSRAARSSIKRPTPNTTPRDEVTESINMSMNGSVQSTKLSSDAPSDLGEVVKMQIHQFVTCIANLYRRNPFHNFEHAIHVVMSTRKMFTRVIKSENLSFLNLGAIMSDPLVQFAIVFSALIHDVDHPGVSNAQLVKEGTDLALQYNNKSVAEQNSITVAWDLLMQPEYTILREAIMPNDNDQRLFRQVVVNSVMATDLFDADLRQVREQRWQRAYGSTAPNTNLQTVSDDPSTSSSSLNGTDGDDCNRRATIIIEHIIQVSDVSHTMQHWHVYQQWNYRLLQELYAAFASGRADKDPLETWYDGELWFFDNYIIPLAKKLKTCGVFGVSCDELLDYAMDNRAEWATKGKDIVAMYAAEMPQQLEKQKVLSSRSCPESALNQDGNESYSVRVGNMLESSMH